MTDHKAKFRRIMELEDAVQNMEHNTVRTINELDGHIISVDSIIMAAVAFENEAFGRITTNSGSQPRPALPGELLDILRGSINTWYGSIGEMRDYEEKLQSFHALSVTYLKRIKSIGKQITRAKEQLYNFPPD